MSEASTSASAAGTAENIPQLFRGLHSSARKLRHTSVEERTEKIQQLLKAVLDAREDIRAAVREELALCDTDIDAQLLMIKAEAEFIAKNLQQWVRKEPIQGSIMTLGKKSYVQYEPKGVVLCLASWNAPYAIGLVPAMGALAAGNAVCLKPSELAPASSALIKRIVESVYPRDEFAVVEGAADVAQELLAQPFNHVFYVGGHSVGRIVMKAAAEQFASVTLEMGGKNPAIIGPSADIEETAGKIAWGRISNAGQVCIAPDYVLAHESVADEFSEKLQESIRAMYDADGLGFQKSQYYPRIINDRHFERVKGLIDDAREKGAEIAFGGDCDASDRYIGPTIIRQAGENTRIMQEEVFGPVITITPYSARDEVLETIERRPKPLSLYVFSRDRDEIDFYLANTTAGNSVVNHNVIQSGTNPNLPFGGVNASGTGRIGGWYTFAEASNARSVMEEGPPVVDPDLTVPPYGDKYKKMVDDMLNKTVKMPNMVINGINGVIKLRSLFRRIP